MPAPSPSDRIQPQARVLLGPADPTSLENRICGALPNGAICFVEDQEQIYYFVKESTTPPSGVAVIATGQGASEPGRWFRYSGGASGVTGPTGPTGATGPTGPAGLLQQTFYVSLSAPAGGDGSIGRPFNTLKAAVDASPSKPTTQVIYIAPGDYGSEPPSDYTDKVLCIIGAAPFNQSGDSTPTHGVHLRPTSSDNSQLILQISRTNSNIIPQSQGIEVIAFQSYVEMVSDGIHFGNFRFEGSPDTMRAGSEGTAVGSVYCQGCGLAETIIAGELFMNISEVNGDLTLTNHGTPRSVVRNTNVKFGIAASHPLEIWNCTFPLDGSAVIINGGLVTTDLATYARGVDAGVTWPENVAIIEQDVSIQPFYVGSGTGSNSLADPTPAYGANEEGDLFTCDVNGVGSQTPSLPAGWSLWKDRSAGGLISQVWKRDLRATGSDSGTITVSAGTGNFPTQAIIHTWRHVSEITEYEDLEDATTAGAGPTTSNAPSVSATGPARTAVLVSFSNGTIPPDATEVSGETGGSWQLRNQWVSGTAGVMALQTAALATDGTVSGGTFDMPGTRVNQISFALIGETT